MRHPIKTVIRSLLVLFLAFSADVLFSQNITVNGKVTDEDNRQPLAFVNVVINDGQQGVITDINGKYEISSNQPITKLTFSSIGYETKTIELLPNQKKCNVVLRPTTFNLNEVIVEAGENPAHRIIDSLLVYRKANNPNSLASYKYNI